MCGRYGQWSRRQRIKELLGIEPSADPDFPDLYSITPGVETWIACAKDGKLGLYSYLVQPKHYQRWLDPESQDVADFLATPHQRDGSPTR